MADYDAAVTVLNPTGGFPVVLTCEHAAYTLPGRYGTLGLAADDLRRHIGWDIGAWAVVRALLQHVDSAAVSFAYSRLLIDCNRAPSDHDLILPESDGTPVPGNRRLTDAERQRRVREFYDPYHAAVDRIVRDRADASRLLLSVHSFTPTLDGKERPFRRGRPVRRSRGSRPRVRAEARPYRLSGARQRAVLRVRGG